MVHLGVDRITYTPDGIEIETAREMDTWQASANRRTVVRFRGEAYIVTGVHAPRAGPVRYSLARADVSALEIPGSDIVYDAAYVEERELRRRVEQATSAAHYSLLPLMPLLGFLPSGVKMRLHARLGLHPMAMTTASIFLELLIISLCGVFTLLGITGVFPGAVIGGMVACALILFPDLVVRRARTVVSSLRQYGFYEWLFRRFRDGD